MGFSVSIEEFFRNFECFDSRANNSCCSIYNSSQKIVIESESFCQTPPDHPPPPHIHIINGFQCLLPASILSVIKIDRFLSPKQKSI